MYMLKILALYLEQVESLAAARQAAIHGSEPADAVRAVNALLTGLDSLASYPNVMVLTTSNLTTAIDLAFVDRADIKAYLGPPDLQVSFPSQTELAALHSCHSQFSSSAVVEMLSSFAHVTFCNMCLSAVY